MESAFSVSFDNWQSAAEKADTPILNPANLLHFYQVCINIHTYMQDTILHVINVACTDILPGWNHSQADAHEVLLGLLQKLQKVDIYPARYTGPFYNC